MASLGEGSLEVTVVPASGVPASLTTLAGYDSIVLDNVLWISKKEKAITRMLGALQVQVRSET